MKAQYSFYHPLCYFHVDLCIWLDLLWRKRVRKAVRGLFGCRSLIVDFSLQTAPWAFSIRRLVCHSILLTAHLPFFCIRQSIKSSPSGFFLHVCESGCPQTAWHTGTHGRDAEARVGWTSQTRKGEQRPRCAPGDNNNAYCPELHGLN